MSWNLSNDTQHYHLVRVWCYLRVHHGNNNNIGKHKSLDKRQKRQEKSGEKRSCSFHLNVKAMSVPIIFILQFIRGWGGGAKEYTYPMFQASCRPLKFMNTTMCSESCNLYLCCQVLIDWDKPVFSALGDLSLPPALISQPHVGYSLVLQLPSESLP